ncbi:unnamed protein product [Moneuplotes crassus]|uniref:Importin subunit alpha n=1 Tax=Euplotes crassus TaxID=5936 RepID=A0AAD1U8C6_EUPCR|nr:unnamed protein product [Moneuplotes crassus]
MEQNKTSEQSELFRIDKTSNKNSLKVDGRIQNRTNQFLNNKDADELRINRSEHNEASRKVIKTQKFAKNRNYRKKDRSDTNIITGTPAEKIEHTITQAQSLWEEGMDIMDYFLILRDTKFELIDFPLLQGLIKSDKDHNILLAVVGLRKLLSLVDNSPDQCVVDADLLPLLITLISRDDFPKIQFEALWCLTNIASGKAEHVKALVDKGTIPVFISLLGTTHRNEDETETYHNSHRQNIVEQSIWALGNIAGEDTYYKAMIFKEGALKPLVNILKNAEPNSMMTRNCMWCITNLLINKPFPTIEELVYIIPIISKCLKSNEKEEIVIDGIRFITYISYAGKQTINKMIELGIIEILNSYLKFADDISNEIILLCVKTLGNFASAEEEQTQAIIDAGVLPHFHDLLSHPDKTIVKEVCWALSNICVGPNKHISVLIELGTIKKLIELAKTGEHEVQKEAAWAICNLIYCKDIKIIEEIAKKGGIEAICYILKNIVDTKIAVILLEGIIKCLEAGKRGFINENGENEFALIVDNCGGLSTIESLQIHQNQYVYELCCKILDGYFIEDEDNSSVDFNIMIKQF